jgi:molybdopterin converting factor small subunit
VVEVEGKTVGQCLQQVVAKYPETGKWLFLSDSRLKDNVDIFVNGQNAFPEELAKPVQDGDDIHIIIVIAGG